MFWRPSEADSSVFQTLDDAQYIESATDTMRSEVILPCHPQQIRGLLARL